MKSKLIGGLVLVGAIALFVKVHIDRRAERATIFVKRARIEQSIRDAVSESVARYQAITDWDNRLSNGEQFRLSPVLTIELEKLWESDRPILFLGSIRDISSAGDDTYSVLVQQSPLSMSYRFATELRLSLIANRSLIDTFLEAHPELLSDAGLQNGVAVVASIDAINAADEYEQNGDRVDVKIGVGELLDLIYTGDAFFSLMK